MCADKLGRVGLVEKSVCLRCGHEWVPRIAMPQQCPACKSRLWAEARASETVWEDNCAGSG